MLRVHFERADRWLSQPGVSQATNIPQPYISAIERGTRHPTPEELRKLSDLFGVPPDDLLKPVVIDEARS